jgi:ATP-dependent Clp protease ATP-binding subunit ClpC
MIEKLTDRARLALQWAASDAARFNRRSISPTDLVLGILRDPDSIACFALKGLGTDLDHLREQLETRAAAAHEEGESQGEFTPATLQVIQLAIEAAPSTGNGYAGTEHLLLGVIRQQASEAAAVLQENGLDDQSLLTKLTDLNTSLRDLYAGTPEVTEQTGSDPSRCQVCGENPATVHITEIFDTGLLERHVCERCHNNLENM